MSNKILTIGIGVYIRQKLNIINTLNSIFQNLQYNNYLDKIQVMIINDYQTQVEDYKIAKSLAQKYSDNIVLKNNEKNYGIAYTYYKMVHQCNTPYFMAFDSDDILYPYFNIMQSVEFLQNNKKYSGSYSNRLIHFENVRQVTWGGQYDLCCIFYPPYIINHNAIILRVQDCNVTNDYVGNYLSNGPVKLLADFSMFVSMILYKDLYFQDIIRTIYMQHSDCYHFHVKELYTSQFLYLAKSAKNYCQINNFKYENMKNMYQGICSFIYKLQNSNLNIVY